MSDPIIRESGIITGPKTGQTFTATLVANTNLDTDLSATAALAPALLGGVLGLTTTIATQVAFGDAAVTIAASDPPFAAGQVYYFVPCGSHMGLKSTGAAVVNVWYAGRIGP